MNITDDVTNLNEFESYNDLKDSELFLNLELKDKLHILRLAQSKFNDIKDQITDDLIVIEKKFYIRIFVVNIVSQLNNIENPALKIQYLEKNHEKLNILLIANKYKEISDIQDSEEFIKEQLNIINEFLDILKPIPELSIDKDALSISEENIKPVISEEIPLHFDTAINKRLMILNELGVLERLEKYIKDNGQYSDTKLYTLISMVTGIEKIGSIKALMPSMRKRNHDSKNNPYNSSNTREEIERLIYNFNKSG